MGARFLAVGLVLASASYGLRWHSGALSPGAAVLRVLLWAFLASAVGKILGVVVFRRQSRTARTRPESAR